MKYKEVIRQIVFLAFEKSKKESLQVLKTPLSKNISTRIESDHKAYISEKTFVRYYDKFIGGKEKATGVPNRRILDFLCKYIGFDSFIDFYHKGKKKNSKERKRERADLSDLNNLIYKKEVVISRRQIKSKEKLYKYLHAMSIYLKQKIFDIENIYYEKNNNDLHYSM